ncbi:MAG TPA: hypothetical protein VM327_09500 [Candidatus Thermoplasmatota archaeon]|nr:hypothetical protein [Candidatus Thermoplasmatota archaeon]
MHKDANLRKRNALVIPGGLLAIYGFIGLVYVALLRGDNGSCGDASLIDLLRACRSAYVVLAIPLIIGLALVAVGALAARNTSTCRDGHGSWSHFGLAFLISLVVLPLLAFLLAPSVLGADAVYTRGTVEYPITTILAGVTAIGVLMLVPFALLYGAQRRANPCCREKGCFDPCFCDETAAPEEPVASEPLDLAPAPTVVAGAPLAPEPVAPVPPVVEPVAAPASDASDWKSVPADKPAEQWEVVTDDPKAESRKDARSGGRAAPRLAERPTDPAAPPADAMAIAAKWAEEDEEALNELGATPGPGKRRRPLAPKKKSKVKTAKASKPAKPGPPKKKR